VDDSALATTQRSLTADKAVSFTASADGASKVEAIASAAGTDSAKESDKGNKSADDQTNSAAGLASKQSGESKTVSKKSSTDDGSGGGGAVSVGAALALNVARSVADASLSNVTIVAGDGAGTGALSLKAENNMDASAIADASAALGGAGPARKFDGASGVNDSTEIITLTAGHGLVTGDKVVYNKGDNGNAAVGGLTGGGNYFVNVSGNSIKLYDTKANAQAGGTTGLVDLSDGSGAGHNLRKLSATSGTAVGIGIALNIAEMQNKAQLGANTTVTADGFSAQALMKDVGGDQTHTFAAKATSGASGGDTGVAGSFALNYSPAQTVAGLTSSTATVNAGTGDVTIGAANTTNAQVEAKAKTGEAGDTGVGISVGINIAVDNDSRALIADGATLNGGNDVSLTATGSHVVNTSASGGGQSTGATGVGGALALTVADNETEARIGSNLAAPLNVTGAVNVTANHHGSSATTAKADGTGSSTAVGAAIALGFVDDSALARTDRNITADGAVSFSASADGSSLSEATASAKGVSKSGESSKGNTSADDQSKSGAGLASKQSGETKSVDSKQGSASTENGSVSVAASLALNVANNSAIATIGDGRTVIAGDGAGVGSLTVKSANLMAAEAIAKGVAGTTPGGDAIGIGVAINVAQEKNEASIGAGSTVAADGLDIEATTLTRDVSMTVASVDVVDIASEKIFLGAGHGLSTGEKVTYHKGDSGNTVIGGLTDGSDYYVRVEEGGFVSLFDTEAHAKGAGTAGRVDLSGLGSGVDHKFSHGGILGLGAEDVVFDPATQQRVVDLGAGHNLRNGDAIVYENGGGASIGGLEDGKTYYVIVLKDNRVALAASLEDAVAGKAIELGGNGTSSQKLIDHASTFRAEATSGASGGDTGVAGSLSVNYAKTDTQAVVGLDHGSKLGAAQLTLGGGDVVIRAENNTETTVSAKPAGIASGKDTGVGASVAVNISLNNTVAEIENGETVSGSAKNFLVSADSANTAQTYAAAGAQGSGTAVGGAIAIAYVENDTVARIGSGAGGSITLNGDLGAVASHSDKVLTTATGEAAGKGTGVGIALGLNIIQDDTQAEVARGFTGAHNVDVEATSLLTASVESRASVAGSSTKDSKGGDSRDSDQESKAQSDFVNDKSGSSSKAEPTQNTGSSLNTANSNTEKQSGNSSDSGGGTSVAASVAVNYLDAKNAAKIADNVTIVASGDLDVIATQEVDAKVLGLSSATNTEADTGVAAAVGLNIILATNQGIVGASADLTARSIDVEAAMPQSATNTFESRALSGGVAKETAVGGSISVNYLQLDSNAIVGDSAKLHATGGDIVVAAESRNEIQNIAGGAALSTEGGTGVGVAIAVNIVHDLNTNAGVGKNASLNASGSVDVTADAKLTPKSEHLPVIGDLIGDIALTSFAAGVAASTEGAAVGGSSSVNVFFVDTHAYVNDGATVTAGQDINVKAKDELTVFSAAGGLAGSGSSAGVGIGLDVGVIDRSTTAWIGSGADLTATGGNLTIDANSHDDISSIAATFGLSGGSVGVAASIGVQVLMTETRAYSKDSSALDKGTLSAGGNVAVTAKSDLDGLMVAGAIGGGSSAGVGVASTVLVHLDTVEARVGEQASVGSGGASGIEVAARSTEELVTLTASGGFASTAGVAVSPTINVLDETTRASIGRNVSLTGNNASLLVTPDLAVIASDETTLISVAGSIAAAGTAGVGVGADVLSLQKHTEAWIDSGVVATIEGDIDVSATSKEDITSVTAGIAVGGTAGVGANAGVHVLGVTTRAFIGDDPLEPTLSAGAGDVHAGGTVRIAADDQTEIDKYVATVAIGGTAGVGAAATVTVIDKNTEAFIGSGAKVTGDGNTAGLEAATGVFGESFDLAAPVGSSGLESQSANSASIDQLKSGGEVGAPDVDTIDYDGDDGSAAPADPAASGQRVLTADKPLVRGVAVAATNRDDIETYAGAIGGGTVGVAIAAAVNVINTDTHAYIASDAKVNDDQSSANAAQTVSVGAGSDFHHVALAAGVGVGAVGVAPGVDVTVLTAKTQGAIDAGASVKAKDDVLVQAHGAEDILLVGMGVAAGTVGVGGGVSVLSLGTETKATIGGTVFATGDVLVEATDDSKVTIISGALGAGFVGVGASVGVMVIDKDTQATIADNATVDARGNGVGPGVSGVLAGTLENGDAADGFNRSTQRGLVVQAESSEEVLQIGLAAGAGFVGVSGGVTVSVIDSDTSATIGNADINQTSANAGAGGEQDVHVGASNEARIISVAGAVAGGFVGVGGAVTVGTLNNDINAAILAGAKVTANDDVEVNALAIKDIDAYVVSGAGGFVGVAGAVSVWSIGSQLQSNYTDQNGPSSESNSLERTVGFGLDPSGSNVDTGNERIYLGYDTGLKNGDKVIYHKGVTPDSDGVSHDNTAIGGLSDGGTYYVRVVKVGPANDQKSWLEFYDTKAHAEDLGSTAGRVNLGGGYTGQQHSFATEMTKTADQDAADQGERASNEVGNTLGSLDIDVVDTGGNAIFLGAGNGLKTGQQVTYHKGVAGNTVVGGLVDGQTYYVRSESGGYVALYDTKAHASAGGSTGRVDLLDKGSGQDHSFSYGVGPSAGSVVFDPADKHAAPDADESGSSSERLASIGKLGSTSLATHKPTSASVTGALATAPLLPPGTSASIAGGAQVTTTNGDIKVNAVEDLELTMFTGGFAGGAVGAGAGITVASVASNVTASAGGTLSAGGNLTVSATLDEDINIQSFAGGVGFVGLGAAVAVLNDSSTTSAGIAPNAVVLAADLIDIDAVTRQTIDVFAPQVTAGAGAVGASFVKISVENTGADETRAYIGSGAQIGQGAGTVGGLNMNAESTIDVHGKAFGVSVGAIAGGMNFSFVDVKPTVKAEIGDNAKITLAGTALVEANSHMGATSEVFGASIGVLGTIVGSVAQTTLTPTVATSLGSNATITSNNGAVTFRANHNIGDARRAYAEALSGAGGIISGAGAFATAKHNATVSSTAKAGSSINAQGAVEILANGRSHAETKAAGASIGVAAIGGSEASSEANGKVESKFAGKNITGNTLTISASGENIAVAPAYAVAGGLVGGGNAAFASATASPVVAAELAATGTVTIANDIAVDARSKSKADANAYGIAVSGALSFGASVASATVSPTVTAKVISGTLTSLNGDIRVRAAHNYSLDGTTVLDWQAKANAISGSGGLLAGIAGAMATATVTPTTEASLNGSATAPGAIEVLASGNYKAESDATGAGGGAVGFGASAATSTIGGSIKAASSATINGADTVTVQAKSNTVANADGTAVAAGLLAGTFNFATAFVNTNITAELGGAVTIPGDLTVASIYTGSAHAHVGGAEVGKSSISSVGAISFGVTSANATLQPVVRSAILGGATVDAGRTINVLATNTAAGADATAGASGGKEGDISISLVGGFKGSDATARAEADVAAYTGAATLRAGGNININADSSNLATASGNALGIGLLFSVGEVSSQAYAGKATKAYLGDNAVVGSFGVDGLPLTGDDLPSGSLTVEAVSEDVASAYTRASGGGLIGVNSALATAKAEQNIDAYLGASTQVRVGGNVTVHGRSTNAEADADAGGTTGGGVAVGDAVAVATAKPQVDAHIGGGSDVYAGGSVFVTAEAVQVVAPQDDSFNSGDVNLSTNTITLNDHPLQTGDEIVYDAGANSAFGGLESGRTYNVIRTGEDTLQLGVTFNAADINGTTDSIHFNAPHNLRTGDIVYYDNAGGSTIGLDTTTRYAVLVIDEQTIKLRPVTTPEVSVNFAPQTTLIDTDAGAPVTGNELNIGTGTFAVGTPVTYYAPTAAEFRSKYVDIVRAGNDPAQDANGQLQNDGSLNNIYIPGHGFADGDLVVYHVTFNDRNNNGLPDDSDGDGFPDGQIGGLVDGGLYYVEKTNDNWIQLRARVLNNNSTPDDAGDDFYEEGGIVSLSPQKDTAADRGVVHTLQRPTDQPINGLVSGQTYFVVDPDNDGNISLATSVGGAPISLDATGLTGTHRLVYEGANIVASSGFQRLVIDISSAASGDHKILGAGGVPLSQSVLQAGDGVSVAKTKGLSGGFIGIQGNVATVNVTPVVEAYVGAGTSGNATNLWADGELAITASTNVNGLSNSVNGAGGFIAYGSAKAISNLNDHTGAWLGDKVDDSLDDHVNVTVGGDFDLSANSRYGMDSFAEAKGGGFIDLADSEATVFVDYDTAALVGRGVTATVAGNAQVVADTAIRANTNSRASAAGFGADADASDNGRAASGGDKHSLGVRVGENGGAQTRVETGPDAVVAAQGGLDLQARISSLDLTSNAYATAAALGADCDATAGVQVNSDVKVVIGAGGRLTGIKGVDIGASVLNVDTYSRSFSDFYGGGGDTDGYAVNDLVLRPTIDGVADAMIVAGPPSEADRIALDVQTRVTRSGDGYYVDGVRDGSGIDFGDSGERGSFDLVSTINWNSDVRILSGPAPTLVVKADGVVDLTQTQNVTGNWNTTTGIVSGPEIVVDDIFNDDPGQIRFKSSQANTNGSDIGINGTIQTLGGHAVESVFDFIENFDKVTLINNSQMNLMVNDIDPINRTDKPQVLMDVPVNAAFEFGVIHSFTPTLITIDNTALLGGADIKLNGFIDNPIGITDVHAASGDITDTGPGKIRTNVLDISTDGGQADIGTATDPITIELVQSHLPAYPTQAAMQLDTKLTAVSERDIWLDLTGRLRQTGVANFTINIDKIDAGRDATVYLHQGRADLTEDAASYSIQVHQGFPSLGNGFTTLYNVIDHWRPGPAGPSYEFPLGVFGIDNAPVISTFDFSLIQAGRNFGTNPDDGDINIFADTDGALIHVAGNSNIVGSGQGNIDVTTNGNVVLEETEGDMRIGRVESTQRDVTLTSANASIIDAPDNDPVLGDDVAADVIGRNITLVALSGGIGEPCLAGANPPVDFLDIDSSNSADGVVNAHALNDIYLDETLGNLNIDLVKSDTSDVDLHTRAGGMLDAGGSLAGNNIEARSIDLIAVGGAIGETGNDLDIDTDHPLGPNLGGSGRLYARATGSIYLTETDEELDVLRAESTTGAVRLTVPDELDSGEDFNLLAGGETLECETIGAGLVDAATSVLINVGDNVTMAVTSTVIAGTMIDVYGDRNGIADAGQSDTGTGTTMILQGTIETRGNQAGERANFYGNVDNDSFILNDLQLNTQTNLYGSNSSATPAAGANEATDVDGRDSFTVNKLRTMTTHRNGAISGEDRRDTLNLDGQGDTDTYTVFTGGSLGGNTGGQLRDYIVNVLDTGAKGDGEDTLDINGSADADIFLLRQLSQLKAGQEATLTATEYYRIHGGTPPDDALSMGYVALLHGVDGTASGQIRETDPLTGYVTNGASNAVERINYTENINARMIVRGLAGDDVFAVDDNAAITTLDGGLGKDSFQIGQMYGAPRVAPPIEAAGTANPPGLAAEDSFQTIRTTRGDLSRGASFSLVAMGDKGDDTFTVYSNKAEIRLEGNDDNDTFIVRAFALADVNYQVLTFGGVSTENTTLVQPGDGDDLVQYNINAPVDVDGGRGFDRLVVLGTEFGDNFVITDTAIWGAGLKVTYENIEAVEVDGLEGNDQFFVLSTAPRVITTVIGGLGSDTIDIAGDVTGPIQARELEGRGSMINHTVTSALDDGYDGLNAPGVRLNIATPDNGAVVITESDNSTVVGESGLTDSYLVKLGKELLAGEVVYVTVSASRTTAREEGLGGDSVSISTNGGPYDKYVVLRFDSSNWNTNQTVDVHAVNDTLAEGERVYAISHTVQSTVDSYNHLAVKNVKVTVLDNDKPDIQILPNDFQTLILEGDATAGISDTYTLKLATVPVGTVWVKLDFDAAQMAIATVNPAESGRLAVVGNVAYVLFAAGTNTPLALKLTAVDDAVIENRGWSTITHSISSDAGHATADADYLSSDPEIKPTKQYLDVEVVDNDTAGVLITESNGRTLVVQDLDDSNNATQDDTYTIRLTKLPAGPVTVWLNDDGQSQLTVLGIDPSRIVTNAVTGKTGVVFDAGNWFTPVTINVHAVNDFQPTPLQEVLIPFAKSEHLLNDLRGPLFIEGGVVEADRSIGKPVMLPDEVSPPPKAIGVQAPEHTRIDVVRVYNDGSVANDVGFLGDGSGALPYQPKEKDGGTPKTTRLSGLSMSGDWTAEGYNPDGSSVTFAGGVTFHGAERFELLMGQGNDNLTISNTLFVSGTDGIAALYGGLSVIHGGGGNDTITVTGQAGGADSPLVVYGDTSADGYRYSWTGADGTTISENATGFDNFGNDLLDASGALGTVTLYGGRGNDRLIGGAAGDTLAGGSGNDIIVGNGGNDHIYGDSGINVDLVSRRFGSDMSGLPNWFVKVGGKFQFDNTYQFDPDGGGPLGLQAAGLALLDPSRADDLTAWLVDTSRETWQDSLDSGNDLISAGDGNDIIFGDHGIIKQTDFGSSGNLLPSLDRKVLGTGTGLADLSNTVTLVQSRSNQNGGVDTVFAGTGEDVVIGGANGDKLDGQEGKDLIFGDNVTLDRSATRGDLTNPRFRVLGGTTIYSNEMGILSGQPLVTSAWQVDPDGSAVWTDYRVELEDHDAASANLLSSGNDYIAGGAGNDQVFGEMGNDVIQGDGSIGSFNGSLANRYAGATATLTAYGAYRTPGGASDPVGPLTVNASFEAAGDGDDYIEGNGGNDVVFGNLGQDDIVGGTSTMFGEATPGERPDGADLLFGGAGTDISYNNIGDATIGADGTITPVKNGHARDADMILGDNGDIHRLRGVNGVLGVGATGIATSGGYLNFNYDINRPGEPGSDLRIIARSATLVDYTVGGPDYNPTGAASDIGGNDEVHGESGDDFIYGMKGDDKLFGDGQDDDLIGNWGNDWISGGTGSDGALGDDGRIYTSRNSSAYGEPLNGVAALLANDPDSRVNNGNVINEVITTPGNAQLATINVANQLKKTVDLTPFNLDPSGIGAVQNTLYRPHNADDIIYGGLGNDFLHGGAGDDAISGAEALDGTTIAGYTQIYGSNNTLLGAARSDFSRPFNPGDALRWNPDDIDGWHRDTSRRSGEFALYDEYDPLTTIRLDTASGAKVGATAGGAFFLNFDPTQGVLLSGGTLTSGGQTITYAAVRSDGDDVIFGDLGNDWIVGGSGRDNLYGGYGNDLLNADDDQRTNGGLNNQPDTHPSYEDRAFGGAGRDVLIANTGGDRLIDWVGEFNSYLVPFAPFGTATVSRTLQPQLAEFLYALSAGDGADATRDTDQGLPASDPRNGEPNGELGLLRQQDQDFHDQTGAPTDPQAGNIPGGKRDVLRSASFDNGQAQGFLVDSGAFSVTSGVLQVEAASLGKDAVAVYQIGDALPSYFEMLASVKTMKPTAGWKADAYLIFDYNNYHDFKFAGFDISTNKLVIGHRDASGWIVDNQTNINVKADTFYSMKLVVNGVNASITFNNGTTLVHTFMPRMLDGLAYGLNWGLVGVGSDNSRGAYDNISVQVVPPQVTWQNTETFADGVADLFTGGQTGIWTSSVASGNYAGTPGAGGPAITLLDIGPDRLQLASMLDLSAKVRTQTSAGFIFDQYSANDYKFVAIDQVADKVLIGHYLNGKTTIDASFAKTILAGTDYRLGVTLVGSTVNVTLDGAAVGGKAYNAVTVDGRFGLFAKDGTGTFDDVTIKTNDPQMTPPASSPMMATEISRMETNVPDLTQAQIDQIASAAMLMWRDALGDGDPRLAALGNLHFVVADLVGGELGRTEGRTIMLDVDAAGHGWYVDLTAGDASEFSIRLDRNVLGAGISSEAFGRMDLLTVMLHEIGHVLGFDHDDTQRFAVMDDDLEPGVRYILDHIGFDGDPDQPISDQALLQLARRAAIWEESMAMGASGKTPPAFDWGTGSGSDGASVDWQDSSGKGWSKNYSPFNLGKSMKGGEGNVSDFFFKLMKGNGGVATEMASELQPKSAPGNGPRAWH